LVVEAVEASVEEVDAAAVSDFLDLEDFLVVEVSAVVSSVVDFFFLDFDLVVSLWSVD